MNIADYYKPEEFGEGVSIWLVLMGWNRDYGRELPCVRLCFVPARMPLEKLKRAYPEVRDGYFGSREDALDSARELCRELSLDPSYLSEAER